MKILYVARHDGAGADEEGAISHALEQLGHLVCRVKESDSLKIRRGYIDTNCDFLLCHHWHDLDALRLLKMPRVSWCFDLIESLSDDPILIPNFSSRATWARSMLTVCDLCLFTDGEFVWRENNGKANVLHQAADQRIMGSAPPAVTPSQIIFTGGSNHTALRRSFVNEMADKWSSRFVSIHRGVYREDLKALISNSFAVVAPDSPSGPSYWSNRVYTTLGFGGLLFHPRCKELESEYEDKEEIVFYNNRPELHALLQFYLDRPDECAKIRAAGLERTKRQHTYAHRVELLIKWVEERLL